MNHLRKPTTPPLPGESWRTSVKLTPSLHEFIRSAAFHTRQRLSQAVVTALVWYLRLSPAEAEAAALFPFDETAPDAAGRPGPKTNFRSSVTFTISDQTEIHLVRRWLHANPDKTLSELVRTAVSAYVMANGIGEPRGLDLPREDQPPSLAAPMPPPVGRGRAGAQVPA